MSKEQNNMIEGKAKAKKVKESSIDWIKLFAMSLFFGFFGVDRFLAGRKISGTLKLLFPLVPGGLIAHNVVGVHNVIGNAGFFCMGLWYIVDLFLIASGRFTDSYGRRVSNTATQRYIYSLLLLVMTAPIIIIVASEAFTKKTTQIAKTKEPVVQEAKTRETAVQKANKGSFTDSRDSKIYKTIKIGTQTWMAENLNYNAKGSKCYNNEPAKCAQYGRLYDWKTALNVCPSGWHLPSYAEYETLDDFAGGKEVAGKKFRAKNGWSNDPNGKPDNGTDVYGFLALPGGSSTNGNFANIGILGDWWSSTAEVNNNRAYGRAIGTGNDNVFMGQDPKHRFFSVRCLKD